MKTESKSRAFSLIEVIIAVGLFAGSIAVIIGLMAALSRQATDALEQQAAQRLPDALKVELQRLAGAGFDRLAAQIPVISGPLDKGLAFAASRESAEVVSLDYLPPAERRLATGGQYYLAECWRFPTDPLRYDAGKAFLALHVRVSWPYRLPDTGTPVRLEDRSQLTFVVSINR